MHRLRLRLRRQTSACQEIRNAEPTASCLARLRGSVALGAASAVDKYRLGAHNRRFPIGSPSVAHGRRGGLARPCDIVDFSESVGFVNEPAGLPRALRHGSSAELAGWRGMAERRDVRDKRRVGEDARNRWISDTCHLSHISCREDAADDVTETDKHASFTSLRRRSSSPFPRARRLSPSGVCSMVSPVMEGHSRNRSPQEFQPV